MQFQPNHLLVHRRHGRTRAVSAHLQEAADLLLGDRRVVLQGEAVRSQRMRCQLTLRITDCSTMVPVVVVSCRNSWFYRIGSSCHNPIQKIAQPITTVVVGEQHSLTFLQPS